MSAQDRLVKVLTDWLEDQPSSAPDQLLDSILTDLQRTRQRTRWTVDLRRLPMFGHGAFRFYGALGAVLVAAAVGFALFGGPRAIAPGEQPSPSPSSTATPQPTPSQLTASTPEPTAALPPDPTPRNIVTAYGPLGPGIWFRAGSFPVQLTFEVPSEGWLRGFDNSHTSLSNQSDSVWLGFQIVANLYADPCQIGAAMASPRVGETVEELADALAALPGLEVSGPVDVALGGYAGKQVVLAAPESLEGCTILDGVPVLMIWRTPSGAEHLLEAGDVNTIWILDVDGIRLVVSATVAPYATEQERVDMEHIINTTTFAPAASD